MFTIKRRLILYATLCGGVLIYFLLFKKDIGISSPDEFTENKPEAKRDSTIGNIPGVPLPMTNGKYLIDTKQASPDSLISFAKKQIGIPYLYASTDPAKGFDCSGFITYVFNHFGIAVPRSSVDFTHAGEEISLPAARKGDLILFTGTDSTERVVGHMGIVVTNADTLQFIHSSSGKANGVTITPFANYYVSRFVKVIRIFP